MTLTPDCWDFCFKGLLLDLEDGNLLKLGEDGTVLRASHGTRLLTGEEILETYGKKRKWKHFKTINGTFARSGKYHFYDNYFDLPGALLCARVVDILDQNRTVKKYEFWKDVIASIEYNYKASAFKGMLDLFWLDHSREDQRLKIYSTPWVLVVLVDQDVLEDLEVLPVQVNQVYCLIFFHNNYLGCLEDLEDQALLFLLDFQEILGLQVDLLDLVVQQTLSFLLFQGTQVPLMNLGYLIYQVLQVVLGHLFDQQVLVDPLSLVYLEFLEIPTFPVHHLALVVPLILETLEVLVALDCLLALVHHFALDCLLHRPGLVGHTVLVVLVVQVDLDLPFSQFLQDNHLSLQGHALLLVLDFQVYQCLAFLVLLVNLFDLLSLLALEIQVTLVLLEIQEIRFLIVQVDLVALSGLVLLACLVNLGHLSPHWNLVYQENQETLFFLFLLVQMDLVALLVLVHLFHLVLLELQIPFLPLGLVDLDFLTCLLIQVLLVILDDLVPLGNLVYQELMIQVGQEVLLVLYCHFLPVSQEFLCHLSLREIPLHQAFLMLLEHLVSQQMIVLVVLVAQYYQEPPSVRLLVLPVDLVGRVDLDNLVARVALLMLLMIKIKINMV
ncbi:hypothetical protein chiPu_0007211 [Chiloscyllium punctatum]|uniref:Uncharacterized protein n=1 Tax=Chiloscyllium punctatum TaxID=137246 RepID=A0A401SED3_CHIPU|nr:hypothetical protein [Chiloscyllium punctatum]